MNKFFELWLLLTAAERGRFLKFAASTYFNDTAWLVPLAKTMNELSEETIFAAFENTEKESKKENKFDEQIFEAVFNQKNSENADKISKKKTFDLPKYNRLLSDATRYLLRFIQIENLPPPEAATIWYAKNGFKRYEALALQAKQGFLAQPLRDSTYYEMRLRSEKLAFEYGQKVQNFNERSNLNELHHNLDVYFLSEKLRYTCEVLNHQNLLQHTYTIQGVNDILHWLDTSDYRNEPPISVYLQVYQLLTTKSEADFLGLKMLLLKHEAQFSATELKEIYGYTINFCIRQVNNGNEQYLSEYLNIIDILLENKAIFENGELAVSYYKNTIAAGLRIGEYDRMEHFIQKYSQFLPKEERENAVTYNLAKLYFAKANEKENIKNENIKSENIKSENIKSENIKSENIKNDAAKNYEKVLEFLREVDYNNVFYALDSRWLLLKTYYSLGEIVALDSAMQAFRIYLLRNTTISTYTKQQYLELLGLLKKLTTLSQKKRANAAKLYAKIAQKNIVADKKWLLQQVEAFI